jgi:hypothetical protein
MHSATCDHRQFIQRNFEGLSNGASRRALRRIASQLSRPRAAIAKAAAERYFASSANENCIHYVATIESNVAASFGPAVGLQGFLSRSSRSIRRSKSGFQWRSSCLAAKYRGAA